MSEVTVGTSMMNASRTGSNEVAGDPAPDNGRVATHGASRAIITRADIGPPIQSSLEVVPRSRLDDRYRHAAGSLVRVLAPGGYGKSMLVRRWVSADRREVRWLDLERVDNDVSVLVDALREMLSDLAGFSFDELPPVICGAREFSDLFVPAFGSLVRSCHAPFVLVLDDIHHVDTPKSTAIIEALARNLPEASTLVIAGRAHDIGDSIGRLRLSPGVIDVTLDDLAFDLAETEEMLSGCGIDVGLEHMTELAALCEGWPAAIRLAALVIRAAHGVSPTTLDEIADATYLVDFLRDEWLDRLTADETQFATEIACLDRFTGEMCDDVLGRHESASLLRDLHRRHLVVTPLDRRDGWYRMHPLVARWLSSELKARDRARWHDVHARAARWHTAAGRIDAAIDHAGRAGSQKFSAELFVAHAEQILGGESHRSALSWLEALPADLRRSSAQLCRIAALTHFIEGDGGSALWWSRFASQHAAERSGGLGPDDEAIARIEVVGAAVELGPAAATIGAIEHARRQVTGGFSRAFACWALGGAMFVEGDDRCTEILAEGAFEAKLAGAHALHAACAVTRGIVLDLQGDRDALVDACRGADSVLVVHRLPPSAAAVVGDAARCLVDARGGDRAAATGRVSICRSHLTRMSEVAPWYNVLTRLALVSACLLIDDARSARELVGEVRHHLRFEAHRSAPLEHVDVLEARVATATDLLACRSWTLTTAELRVIQYLPTNLSLADIATRLFVSRNTVKSHVAAIYRKFGTSSRTRVVELAREAGILSG